MSGRVRFAIVALLVGSLTACAELPQRRYYTLDYPSDRPAEAGERKPLHPVTVRVDRFDAALPFDRSQIVYRESPYQFSYYSYRLWAAKPQRMLREVTVRHLQTSRVVASVIQDYGQDLPEYELSATVEALEEYDSGDVWYGHLAMSFELVRFKDQTPVWSYRFDRKKRVAERKLVLVVRAVSRIAEEELHRVVAQLDHVLARERGVQPTLRVPPPTRDEVVGREERGPEPPPVRRERPPREEPEEERPIITPGEPPPGEDEEEDLITPDEPRTSGGGGEDGEDAP